MSKNTAAELAASVDKVVAHLTGQGPRPTTDEIRTAHRQLDQAQDAGITADDVRQHRR